MSQNRHANWERLAPAQDNGCDITHTWAIHHTPPSSQVTHWIFWAATMMLVTTYRCQSHLIAWNDLPWWMAMSRPNQTWRTHCTLAREARWRPSLTFMPAQWCTDWGRWMCTFANNKQIAELRLTILGNHAGAAWRILNRCILKDKDSHSEHFIYIHTFYYFFLLFLSISKHSIHWLTLPCLRGMLEFYCLHTHLLQSYLCSDWGGVLEIQPFRSSP